MTCAALGASADQLCGQAPAAAVQQLLAYHLDDGGRWRQDNPDFEPGSEQPAYWLRVLEWGPARDVVIADAFAVSENGRCDPVAHMVYYWDIRNARVAVNSFNARGVVAEGYLEPRTPTETRLVASLLLPDGSNQRIRDTSDRSRPGEYTTRAERWVNGEWIAGDAVTWLRDPNATQCG